MNSQTRHNVTFPDDLAVEKGNIALVETILEAGADLSVQDDDGYTPLLRGIFKNDGNMVSILLKASADVSLEMDLDLPESSPLHSAPTALHLAAERGSVEIVEMLLEAGAPMFHYDESGDTPLHIAVKQFHKEIVRVMLARGGELQRLVNKDGDCALHTAIKESKEEIVYSALA